jgi:hypothetical protein
VRWSGEAGWKRKTWRLDKAFTAGGWTPENQADRAGAEKRRLIKMKNIFKARRAVIH